MKRLLILLLASSVLCFSACATTTGKLSPESLKALRHLRNERIMCPNQLFTNCTLDADFAIEQMQDSVRRTFEGQLSTSNRCFGYSHNYLGKMFDEPVGITTVSDTTGYAERLMQWVKSPLDFDNFLSVFSLRKRAYESIDAQLEYLGTEDGTSRYRVYYVIFDETPVECLFWCDTNTRCVTRATISMVLTNGNRLRGEVLLDPYSGISRTSYPPDGCYLKFARQIDYRLTSPEGTERNIRLWNIHLNDIGVYKTVMVQKLARYQSVKRLFLCKLQLKNRD